VRTIPNIAWLSHCKTSFSLLLAFRFEVHARLVAIDELDAGGLKGAPKGSLREANFKYQAKRQDLSKTSSASLWLRPGSNIRPQS
jgi:hypothetical protein